MKIYEAIILGIVQGLTEFLPISSSGHLNLIPLMLGWKMPESFDVALHLGTLLAITIFFFKDWIKLFVGGYKQAVKKERGSPCLPKPKIPVKSNSPTRNTTHSATASTPPSAVGSMRICVSTT